MSEIRRIRTVVEGYVQGVGYRWFAAKVAQRLSITGWVRNNPDGTVESVAEGPRDAIGEYIGELRRGPFGADVTDIVVTEEEPTGEFPNFDIAFYGR